MAGGMFGGPVGEQAYLDTALKAMQVGVNTEHTLGEIAMQPDRARVLRAQAGLAELQAKEEELWQQLAQTAATGATPQRQSFTGPPGPQAEEEQSLWQSTAQRAVTTDPLVQMDNLAALAAQRGLTGRALKILDGTAAIRQKQASEASSRSTQALNTLKFLKEDAENLAQFFGGARSQEELDTANALFQFQTGKPSPFANIPFDQGIIDSVNRRAVSAKERYQLSETAAHHRALEDHQSKRRAQHDSAQRISQERLDLEREREERLRKQGEEKAKRPTTVRHAPRHVLERMERDAGRLLQQDYPGADKIDAAMYNSAKSAIAAEAAAALQRNPALNMSQAVAQAYTNARQAGDIEFEQGMFGGRTNLGGKFKYSGGGRTAETALPIPATPSDAKVGRFYVSPSGRVGKWDGKQFQLVQ